MSHELASDRPVGTEPLRRFAATVSELSHLGTLLQTLPQIVRQLEEADPEAPELAHLHRHHFMEWPLIQAPGAYIRVTNQTVLCRVIDGFRLYVSAVIHETLKAAPRSLRDLPPAPTLWDVGRVVENRLSQGMPALGGYISDALGHPFPIEGDAYVEVLTAVAVRNAVIYNGGDTDAEFALQVGLGERQSFSVDTSNVLDWIDALAHLANIIDAEFVERFQLTTADLFPEDGPVH